MHGKSRGQGPGIAKSKLEETNSVGEMADVPKIEIRGFMDLADLFRQRNWPNPLEINTQQEMTGIQLLRMLDIPLEKVEAVFVNGKAVDPSMAVISGGDRVALAPPGVPGPYRVLLGFRKLDYMDS